MQYSMMSVGPVVRMTYPYLSGPQFGFNDITSLIEESIFLPTKVGRFKCFVAGLGI